MPDQSTPPPVDLSILLNQAGYAIANRLTAALAGLDMSVRVYRVLAKAAEGDHTQGRLAELAWMDKTTMVVTLDEMERRGLAERRLSPQDRRVRVAITAKGRRQLAKADAIVHGVYDEVLGGVGPAERETFLGVLGRLVDGPGWPRRSTWRRGRVGGPSAQADRSARDRLNKNDPLRSDHARTCADPHVEAPAAPTLPRWRGWRRRTRKPARPARSPTVRPAAARVPASGRPVHRRDDVAVRGRRRDAGEIRRPCQSARPRAERSAPRADAGLDLAAVDARATPGFKGGKAKGRDRVHELGGRLADLQEQLYAHGRTGGNRGVLLVLQGMDTSGKGGTVGHVAGQVDPAGVRIAASGARPPRSSRHDFLWRIRRRLPRRGSSASSTAPTTRTS